MAKSTVDLTSLDFDEIKTSLKTYLQAQPNFTDYNFEGSNLNILLDILSVNTHYYSVLSNLVGNEMFLDSAIMRSSVVSIAKELGYTPRTARASRAQINLQIVLNGGSQTQIELPRGTTFQASYMGDTFNFILTNPVILPKTATNTFSSSIPFSIYYGKLKSASYTVNALDHSQKFVIPATSIDSDATQVRVYTGSNYSEYYNATKSMDLTSTSNIYFLKETDLGQYELKFGDDILGKALQTGQIVTIEYLLTRPFIVDGADTFSLADIPYNGVGSITLSDVASFTIITEEAAQGSTGPETIDEIKDNAKKFNSAQYRSVNASDYKTNILAENTDVVDVNVWGGEDHYSPMYGKVIISCLRSDLNGISDLRKSEIDEQIKKKSMLGIGRYFIDPERMKISLSGYIRYDSNLLNIQTNQLLADINTAIVDFDFNNLRRFNRIFSYSKFVSQVDSVHPAIKSSVFEMFITQTIVSTLSKQSSHLISFNNPIKPFSFRSEAFKTADQIADVDYYLFDDGSGKIWTYKVENGDFANKIPVSHSGNIDYSTGLVSIINFKGESLIQSPNLDLVCQPEYNEILSRFNQVLLVDHSKTLLEAIAQ